MSEVEELKLCVNCYHFYNYRVGDYLCTRPIGIDLVMGGHERCEELCKDERNSDEPDKCSKVARFFLEKKVVK